MKDLKDFMVRKLVIRLLNELRKLYLGNEGVLCSMVFSNSRSSQVLLIKHKLVVWQLVGQVFVFSIVLEELRPHITQSQQRANYFYLLVVKRENPKRSW